MKVVIKVKLGQVKVGMTSFSVEAIRNVKKPEFDKTYKKMFDVKIAWPLLKQAIIDYDKELGKSAKPEVEESAPEETE